MDNFKGPDGTLVTSNSLSNLGDYTTNNSFSKAGLPPEKAELPPGDLQSKFSLAM